MVATTKLRKVIRDVLTPYTLLDYANGDIHNYLVWDEDDDHYMVMSMGWVYKPMKRRIHGCLIHLDIIDGKVWVQRDGTEDGVAGDLERAGVAKEQIVLGFHDPRVRQYTEYAAA